MSRRVGLKVRDLLGKLGSHRWAQSVLTLLGTNLLAQLLTLALIPILTRIYPPADYAILAGLMAVVMIASLGAAMGFDYAIAVAPDDDEAVALTLAASFSAIAIAIAIAAVCWLLPIRILEPLLGQHISRSMPWILAATIAVASLSTTLEALQVRNRRINAVGWARVAQAVIGIGSQIGLGLKGAGAEGLVLGYFVFLAVPACIHLIDLFRTRTLKPIAAQQIWAHANANRQFVKFTAPEALLNALSVHGPILLIAAFGADPVAAAHISLSMRLLQAPSFLAAKIGSQIVQGAIRDWVASASLARNSRSLLRAFAMTGLASGLPTMTLAPFIAPYILGSAWSEIGWVMVILVPGVVLHMVSFPLIAVAYLQEKNAHLLLLTAAAAIIRIGLCLSVIHETGLTVTIAFGAGAVSQYALLTFFLYRTSQSPLVRKPQTVR